MPILSDELQGQSGALRDLLMFYRAGSGREALYSAAAFLSEGSPILLAGMGASYHAAWIAALHLNSLGIPAQGSRPLTCCSTRRLFCASPAPGCCTFRNRAVAPRARLVNARYEPVVGALLLGLEKAGVEASEAVRANIEASSQRLGLIRQAGN